MLIHPLNLDLNQPAHRANPHAVYARLLAEHPVAAAKHPYFGSCWMLTRHADVSLALSDKRFHNDLRDPKTRKHRRSRLRPRIFALLEDSVVFRDPPEHGRIRGIVAKAFTPRRVAALESHIEEVCHELLDEALRAREVDLIKAFALPLPLRIMAELMGVPAAERERFRVLLDQVGALGSEGLFALLRQLPASRRFVQLLESLIELRRREPDEGLITALAQAHDEGQRLTDAELLSMVFLLLFAGHETTVNLLGNGVLALIEHSGQWQRLADEPERIPDAIEEVLRYDGPAEHAGPRRIAEPLRVGAVELGVGELVFPMLLAANRDGSVFAEPDRFDITRQPKQHLAFGHGLHHCIGAALARLEGRVALAAMRERIGEIRLNVPRASLRWRRGTGVHGVYELPVELFGP